MGIQSSFDIRANEGFPGMIALEYPHLAQNFQLTLANANAYMKPGDVLVRKNDTYTQKSQGDDDVLIVGILTSNFDDVRAVVTNDDDEVRFHTGDEVSCIIEGVVWVTAGAIVDWGNEVSFSAGTRKYGLPAGGSSITKASAPNRRIICLEPDGAVDEGLMKVLLSGFVFGNLRA